MLERKRIFNFLALFIVFTTICAQEEISNQTLDSLYIAEVQDARYPDKVLHAEPLFIDLIRDLGARKGEREWNIGLGLTDNQNFDAYTALIEYEWAPINRLGLEVELPFTLYYNGNGISNAPGSKLNSLKLAAQYSFYVSEKRKTTLALGYIHEFELTEFSKYRTDRLFKGNIFNPFFIAAKRWGNNFHSLIYTGPFIIKHFDEPASTNWQINTNFHYMISGTRNFIGLEMNKNLTKGNFEMILRPQMRLGISDHLMIGIVTGIPLRKESERLSSFVRLIYEPPHKS